MDNYQYEDLAQPLDEDWIEEIEEDLFDDSIAGSQKSPERIARENVFIELYEAYMHPKKPLSDFRRECLLNDLYEQLTKLNTGWVSSRCARYKTAGFYDAVTDEALISGGFEVCQILKKDQETGNYCTYPVSHYLKIARNKIIDQYFRPKYGRLPPKKKDSSGHPQEGQEEKNKPTKRNVNYPISLDGMAVDDSGVYHEDRNKVLAYDPFGDMRLSRRESDRNSDRIAVLYLRELMDYPDEPPKPLALMYGSVLFQIAKEQEISGKLAELAKRSTKLTSPSWAHQAMGKSTLEDMGYVSETIVRRFYQQELSWGRSFQAHMTQLADDGSGRDWGEIVYTASYTEEETSNWIESIFKSTVQKCARKLVADPELMEFAVYNLSPKNKLRKAIAKIEKKKEACR